MADSTSYAKYGGLGGGGGGVTSLNGLTGALTLVSNDGSLSITPSGSTINLQVLNSNLTLTAVGSTPNADGASISGNALTLQPATAQGPGYPGVVTTLAQSFAGDKDFINNVTVNGTLTVDLQGEFANGTVNAPGVAFSSYLDSGLYVTGVNTWGLSVHGAGALALAKSTSGFGNIGMGGAASVSDNYPLLIQRAQTSTGVIAQIANTDTAASSHAIWQLSADAGNNNGDVSLWTAATAIAAYANAMTVRPNGATGMLSLIGGDLSTGYVTTFTGGDYTATGETVRFNADHTNQFMQSVTAPTSPAAGLKFYNNAGVFTSKNSSGTVASFAGSNTGDITLGTANGLSLSGQALSLGTASTSTTGALTSTDWNTFNGKQAALTLTNLTDVGTDGITITNGTGAVIGASPVTIAQHVADASHNGYLSSTDWSTFNGKGVGTVTAVSVASANGFTGSSSGGATPALTLATSITGILQGNGTAISAASTSGSGSVVLTTSPTLVTPALGTPSALVLTNATGLTSSGVATATFTAPTIQRFLSSSGTYTTPTSPRSPLFIKVRMIGGGGGGGGGATAGGAGGTGGSTTFGPNATQGNAANAQANGGGGGAFASAGGAGGTAAQGSGLGTLLLAQSGNSGTGGMYETGITANLAGGAGGAGLLGGGGGSVYSAGGTSGATNSGGGGGGGGQNGTAGIYSGGGGGSGGYLEFIISSPSATYNYWVGSSGTAGAGNNGGFSGGAGGSGIIIVEEYYQ